MNGKATTWGEVMRHKLHGALDGEPAQQTIDQAMAGRDGLEASIARDLSKLAPHDLVVIGWIMEELLDQSTC